VLWILRGGAGETVTVLITASREAEDEGRDEGWTGEFHRNCIVISVTIVVSKQGCQMREVQIPVRNLVQDFCPSYAFRGFAPALICRG